MITWPYGLTCMCTAVGLQASLHSKLSKHVTCSHLCCRFVHAYEDCIIWCSRPSEGLLGHMAATLWMPCMHHHASSLPEVDFAFKRYTAPKVMPAPVSSTGDSTSPSTKKPVMAANSGVRNVRLESAVRLPREALKKKTP